MAVFRVERNTGYTVMSNHHLRNKELSLKAKGLLSQMLSLPEDWDYTLAGLSHINREKIDAIREAVKELEKAGYIVRSRERDEKGRLRGADYVIYEQPQPREPEAATSGGQPPILDLPTLENPTLDTIRADLGRKGFTTSQPLFLTRSRGIWCSLRVHTTPPAFPMWGFMWARTGTEAPSCCIVATLSSIQSWTPAIGNPTFTPTGG